MLCHNLTYVRGGSPQLFSALLSTVNGRRRVPTKGDRTNPTKGIIENIDSGGNREHFFKKEKK